jgi:putative spermidine/putrescine transport system substrate-binding protein
MRTKALKSTVILVASALLLTACGTAKPVASPSVPTKLGDNEKTVSLLGWPGYAENGSNDPAVDWVSPFEKSTGCKVSFKSYGTSDEAISLFKTGDYLSLIHI